MNLGLLMRHLENEADAATALAALGDMTLLAQVQDMGAHHDEAPGEYVANAARRFAGQASDEDWLALMTAMERADQPGRAALDRMIRWSLARDAAEQAGPGSTTGGCTCAGGGGGCHGDP
jgi:hypothetical protein